MDLILVKNPLLFEDEENIPIIGRFRVPRIGPIEFTKIALQHKWTDKNIMIELQICCAISKTEAYAIIERVKKDA